MLSWMLGIAAFLLFFVYDVNSVTLRAPLLHTGFFLGVLLLASFLPCPLRRLIRRRT